MVGGNRQADSCHETYDQVIHPGLGPKRHGDDDFNRKHENTLPPAENADRGEIDVLVGESAERGDGSEEGDSLEEAGVGNGGEFCS